MNTPQKNLAERLAAVLSSRGLRAVDVARLAGVSPAYISQILAGRREAPSRHVLASLAAACGTTPQYLLGEQEPEPSAMLREDPASYSVTPLAARAAAAMTDAELEAQIKIMLEQTLAQKIPAFRLAQLEVFLQYFQELQRRLAESL